MSIKKLAISGLRGFATEQSLTLAIPNGANGSGLTVLVGPNNGGKSTIVEAFKAVSVLMDHMDTWGIDFVQIARPTTGPNAGFLVITVNNPLPVDNLAHLFLTGPI